MNTNDILGYVKAKKQPAGMYRLFFVSGNPISSDLFTSPILARQYVQAMWIKFVASNPQGTGREFFETYLK